jgi:hypothetical protein
MSEGFAWGIRAMNLSNPIKPALLSNHCKKFCGHARLWFQQSPVFCTVSVLLPLVLLGFFWLSATDTHRSSAPFQSSPGEWVAENDGFGGGGEIQSNRAAIDDSDAIAIDDAGPVLERNSSHSVPADLQLQATTADPGTTVDSLRVGLADAISAQAQMPSGRESSEPRPESEAPSIKPRSTASGIRALVETTRRIPLRLGSDEPGSSGTEASAGRSARFFGLTAESTYSVVYVIDCSGSMGRPPTKLLMAKEELTRSIRELQPEQNFYVIFFSDQTFPMPGSVVLPASEPNKQRVCEWIDGASPSGGTNPLPALLNALQLQPETIYVLSDGLFKGDYVRAIRTRNRGPQRTSIYTINFGDYHGERQLLRLARENGGNYRHFEPAAR